MAENLVPPLTLCVSAAATGREDSEGGSKGREPVLQTPPHADSVALFFPYVMVTLCYCCCCRCEEKRRPSSLVISYQEMCWPLPWHRPVIYAMRISANLADLLSEDNNTNNNTANSNNNCESSLSSSFACWRNAWWRHWVVRREISSVHATSKTIYGLWPLSELIFEYAINVKGHRQNIRTWCNP